MSNIEFFDPQIHYRFKAQTEQGERYGLATFDGANLLGFNFIDENVVMTGPMLKQLADEFKAFLKVQRLIA